jgi:hypothetical protein
MHHFRTVRVLTAMALVLPASLATWSVAGPASATTAPTCSVLAIAVTGTGTVSGCTDTANTGGSGKLVFVVKKSPYPGTITWKGTGTTAVSLTYTFPKKSVCAKGDTDIVIGGTVTGGKGAALKSIPKNSKVSAVACYNPKAKPAVAVELAPKQLLHL